MIDIRENELINARLSGLYMQYSEEFLKKWALAFPEDEEGAPCRINEFGILDVNKYDTENGILFICRETNGWKNKDYENGCFFRKWMEQISRDGLPKEGHIAAHPNMWYNIGRWVMLLTEKDRRITDIAEKKSEAITAIGKIAFTNVNKVRGKNVSKKEYYQLAKEPIVQELLKQEIEIINPKIIVFCGTEWPGIPLPDNFSGVCYTMPHPGARKSKINMLVQLNKQM